MLVALSALLLGVLYYGLFRDHALFAFIPGFLKHRVLVTQWIPAGYELLWLPSFVHAFATLLCVHMLVVGGRVLNNVICRVAVLICLIAFELCFGTTDKFDLIAIVAAGMSAEVVAMILRSELFGHVPHSGVNFRSQSRFAFLAIVGVSGLLASGSYTGGSYQDCAEYDGGTCIEYKRPAVPVYMSYQRLRESVQVEVARPPDRLGRVYLYENYVFLNEKNEGIHIIDNTDPASPVNLGFIRIPGNTDLAMRDNYLFADSYVDLITLDMNDAANIQVVNRQEDLFPYDAFQNIPYNVSFRQNDINAQLGVVVSYQLSGN